MREFAPPHIRRHSQVVRQRSAKPLCPSSNLGGASKAPRTTGSWGYFFAGFFITSLKLTYFFLTLFWFNIINSKRKEIVMKIKRIAVFSSLAAAVILICGCILSYIYFETPNCFSAAVGFVQIAAGEDYAEISHSPKVIIAKPDKDVFTKYMNSRGFYLTDRFSSRLIFSNGTANEYVYYSQNAHISKWRWE